MEIFSPHFGASIAQYLATQHLSSNLNVPTGSSTGTSINSSTKSTNSPLVIYELGGGTGTLAKDILNWLRQYNPAVHATCQYTCIEISPTLADLQYQRVVVEQERVHEKQFQVVRGDAADVNTWLQLQQQEKIGERSLDRKTDEPCFVVAMEVLDNLPHDKVVYRKEERTDNDGGGDEGRWLEALVEKVEHGATSSYQEVYQPVSDPLIHQCLQTYLEIEAMNTQKTSFSSSSKSFFQKILDAAINGGSGSGSGDSSLYRDAMFLPTGALRLFNTLHHVRPNHRLLAADFDFLPETVIPGKNAPLVATTVNGATKDHGSYLVQPGVADIFFPSDFELLAALYDQNKGSRRSSDGGGGDGAARYLKTKEFFKQWEEVGTTRCRDGYDPLLEDYSNTSLLMS